MSLYWKLSRTFSSLNKCWNFWTKLLSYNIGAIYMAENGSSNSQTKHVNVCYHFVWELIEDGIIQIKFVKSENNNSDIFTKNVGKDLFYRHSSKFMAEQKIEGGERTAQSPAKRTAKSPREGVGWLIKKQQTYVQQNSNMK